jgi:hypothetical protein
VEFGIFIQSYVPEHRRRDDPMAERVLPKVDTDAVHHTTRMRDAVMARP